MVKARNRTASEKLHFGKTVVRGLKRKEFLYRNETFFKMF